MGFPHPPSAAHAVLHMRSDRSTTDWPLRAGRCSGNVPHPRYAARSGNHCAGDFTVRAGDTCHLRRDTDQATRTAGLGGTAARVGAVPHGVREQVLDGDIATLAGELPAAHGDPADRMRVATAILRDLTLVTADAVLLDGKLRGFRTRDATGRRAAGGGVTLWRGRTHGDLRVKPAGLDGRERHKLFSP